MGKAGVLDTIPAELRIAIYEVAFVTDEDVVHLPEAAPPNKALILTCKKIHNEASSAYKAAYRKYWTQKRFWITQLDGIRMSPTDLKSFDSLVPYRAIDVDHITRLFVTDLGGGHIRKMELENPIGVWKATLIDATHRSKIQTRFFYYKDASGKNRMLNSSASVGDIHTAIFENMDRELSITEQLREMLWTSD